MAFLREMEYSNLRNMSGEKYHSFHPVMLESQVAGEQILGPVKEIVNSIAFVISPTMVYPAVLKLESVFSLFQEAAEDLQLPYSRLH